jgi:DNA mismatch repair protein PMS2
MSEEQLDPLNGSGASGSRTNIVPMNVQDVGRIVAGQAISDLASAVKELIDNALDAGATSITSKFHIF